MSRIKTREWIVSRCRPYPDGYPTVEIATDIDMLDPSLFWEDDGTPIDQLTSMPYNDPRDAINAALQVRDIWQDSVPDERVYVAFANPFYPSYVEGKDDDELRAWADKAWEALPMCDYCGERAPTVTTYSDQYGDEVCNACSEYHAELFLNPTYEEDV